MTTAKRIGEVLAGARRMQYPAVEGYLRVLRQEGVLPETKRGAGATHLSPLHAAHVLIALMRGSPMKAGEDAREVGSLVLESDDLERQLTPPNWPERVTFAQALAWLIAAFATGRNDEVTDAQRPLHVRVDRYNPAASIEMWLAPTPTAPYDDPPSLAVAGLQKNGSAADPRRVELRFAPPEPANGSHLNVRTRKRSATPALLVNGSDRWTPGLGDRDVAGYEQVGRGTFEALGNAFLGAPEIDAWVDDLARADHKGGRHG